VALPSRPWLTVIKTITIIIKKKEIKVTLKTIEPLQGHFTKVIKIELTW